MDTKELFYKYDDNGEPIYYADEDFNNLFTGHIEDYDRDFLCMEADVEDGFIKGIFKEYYFKSDKLETVAYYEHNVQYGLEMEFYENGMVRSFSISICNDYLDTYYFDSDGKLLEKKIWPNSDFWLIKTRNDDTTIENMRKKFNLEDICEDILKSGRNFDYKKYFCEKWIIKELW